MSYMVCVQNFKERNFRGQLKFKDFCGFLFLRIMCYQSLCSICIVIILKKIEDLIFVVDKLPMQEAKIITFKHLYLYG